MMIAALKVAEILKFLSFRGTLRAEESLILLTLEPGEIPHFVRNDKIAYFFRSLFRRYGPAFREWLARSNRERSTIFQQLSFQEGCPSGRRRLPIRSRRGR